MLIPLMAADLFGLRSLGTAMSAILLRIPVTQFWFPPHRSCEGVGQLRLNTLGVVPDGGWERVAIAALPRKEQKESRLRSSAPPEQDG